MQKGAGKTKNSLALSSPQFKSMIYDTCILLTPLSPAPVVVVAVVTHFGGTVHLKPLILEVKKHVFSCTALGTSLSCSASVRACA